MGLQKPQQAINILPMKALLDRALLVITAIVAVSATGAGVYYVSSTSEPVQHGSTCGQKAPCDEAAKPDCGAKPDCTDQKKTEDQNPT